MTVKNFQSLKNLIHFSSMISSFAFLNLITFFFCIQFYHLKKLCFMHIFFPPLHIHVYFFSSTFISFYTFMCYAHKLIITKGRVDSKQLLSGSKSFFFTFENESAKAYNMFYIYAWESWDIHDWNSFKMYHIMRMERYVWKCKQTKFFINLCTL